VISRVRAPGEKAKVAAGAFAKAAGLKVGDAFAPASSKS
jgi:hypothetical protein